MVSKYYQHFIMSNGENNRDVKFIMRMDSIKKEADARQEVILNDTINKNKEN